MTSKEIISFLPYKYPFLFVDEILSVDENSISGSYTFSEELDFYKGHFEGNPITPGVILTETMAQIGLVSFGIYLLNKEEESHTDCQIALTSTAMDFFIPVLPGEKIIVKSEKQYFRFKKLKCKVQMFNAAEELVCRGVISGMMKRSNEA